jgi:hypothetical protein
VKFIILLLVLPLSSFAKIESRFINSKVLSFEIPKGWKAIKNNQIRFAIVGPRGHGPRPAIFTMPTNIKATKHEETQINSFLKNYKSTYEELIKSSNAKLLSVSPKRPVTFPNSHGVSLGMDYSINDVTFSEYTYYLFCKDDLYLVKYSLRTSQKNHTKDILKIIQSFSCFKG